MALLPGPTWSFRKWWDAAVSALGCQELGITPGGLRSGGAIHHWLLYRDLPGLRRRGHWQHEKTVEICLQECMFTLQAHRLEPAVNEKILSRAALVPAAFCAWRESTYPCVRSGWSTAVANNHGSAVRRPGWRLTSPTARCEKVASACVLSRARPSFGCSFERCRCLRASVTVLSTP
jgi:hypothetical protein